MKLSFEQILRLIVIIIEALLRMTDDERHEVARITRELKEQNHA